ncbi:hypothetical protein SK128_024707 [Halocaridina rubra]|uniref:Uncharacterized protein n=1 Tax=Halocaridina rubra TaxID=373956 RepID=A0AAN9A778_HALRR
MFSKSLTSACRLFVAPARQAVRTGQGRLSTNTVKCVKYTPVPEPLANKMKLFQLPNDLPVHLKGGPMDKIMYIFTMSVCIVGLIECFHVYYVLAYGIATKAK